MQLHRHKTDLTPHGNLTPVGFSFIQIIVFIYKNIPPNDLLGGIDKPVSESTTLGLGMGSDPLVSLQDLETQ